MSYVEICLAGIALLIAFGLLLGRWLNAGGAGGAIDEAMELDMQKYLDWMREDEERRRGMRR